MYEHLGETFKAYVDSLLQHARTALWPERRDALEGFRRGIARSRTEDLDEAVRALGDAAPPLEDPAEALYRVLLTAYLERLGEAEVSNPDQARLFEQSLNGAQVERARRWFAEHPEHAVGTNQSSARAGS